MGAYTDNSKGWAFVRQTVADFINKRDGLTGDDKANEDEIFLSNGASEAVRISLSALIRGDHDGVLVPIPQYPLYSAQLTLQKGQLLPYYLNEEKNWALEGDKIQQIVDDSLAEGITPRAIVVINPGNPTG